MDRSQNFFIGSLFPLLIFKAFCHYRCRKLTVLENPGKISFAGEKWMTDDRNGEQMVLELGQILGDPGRGFAVARQALASGD